MRPTRPWRALLILLPTSALLACSSSSSTRSTQATADPAPAQTDPEPWSAPPLERSVSVTTRDGERIELAELYDRLAEADVVFLGETHLDETTHRVELAVYEALLERRDERVVLAMEMFERDVQPVLDRYVAGEIEEEEFLASARPWGNYRAAYRPMVERARATGRPVVASNFPRPLRMRVMQSGLEALADAPAGQAPAEILPNTQAYHRRTDNAVRGHIGMMGGPAEPDDPRLTSTQTLWDNSMGSACADALRDHPGDLVLHVNGGFHSAYWDGTVRQCELRAPDAKLVTVAILPSAIAAQGGAPGVPVADYVVTAQRGPEDFEDGKLAVYVQKELEYVLHLPEGASDDAPVPLLIWLGDDGLTAEDGLALWESRLGEECAIASLDPPYRERMLDESRGGRWFWVDSFMEDTSTVGNGIDGAWGYLLRNFPIDPERVCLAGEGTGASMVAVTTLLNDRMNVEAVAIAPRRYAKIKDYPLPLPEYTTATPDKSLLVIAREADMAWWAEELDAYSEIGFTNQLTPTTDDPWLVERAREGALRSALGLEQRLRADAERAHVIVPVDSPRARHWARLRALASDTDAALLETAPDAPGDMPSTELSLTIDRERIASGAGLPRCPGPFGGTTVLVVPADELAAWLELEAADPLNAKSRFHRLRIATTEASGEHSLAAVLEKLAEENRTNALIVPATFCADDTTMRSLRASARHLDDRMTLHWSPGLGGAE